MTTFTGALQKPINAGEFNPADGSVNLSDYSVPSSRSPLAYAASSVKGGSRSVGGELAAYPVERQGGRESILSWPRAPRALQGGLQPSFAKDVLDRIHIIPASIDVGNLTGSVSRSVALWNTYATTKACSAVVRKNMDGIVTDAGSSFALGPLSARIVNAVIAMDGPPIIDGSLTFVFADLSLKVTFAGRRIVAWVWKPQIPVLESLEWMTDLLEAHDGSEQRIRLRNAPRQAWEISVLSCDPVDQATIETALYGWQGRSWAMPVWAEQLAVTGPLAAGATQVVVDTTQADFRVDGMAMLWQSPMVNEVVVLSGVAADRITFSLPTAVAFAEGAILVLPVRTAKIMGSIKRDDYASGPAKFTATFRSTEPREYTGQPSPEQYLDTDVLLDPLLADGEIVSRNIDRPATIVDYETGAVFMDVPRAYSTSLYDMRWELQDRAEIWALRQWLHRRGGRVLPFFVPSWRPDLQLQQLIAPTDTNIRVSDTGYTRLLSGSAIRKHIMIELNDGSRFFRRVTGSALAEAGQETLSLDAAIGQTINVSDVRRISWLTLCRLNADRIEISWQGVHRASVVAPIKEIAQ